MVGVGCCDCFFWVGGGISLVDVVLLRHQGSQHSLDDLLEINWYLAS